MTLYYVYQDPKTYKLRTDENGNIPEGCFIDIGYSIFISEALAQEYIKRLKESTPILKDVHYSIGSIELNVSHGKKYVHQVIAWVHEESDKKLGYICSPLYAKAKQAMNDSMWLNAIDTIINKNKSVINSRFKSTYYYERYEPNEKTLKDVGSEHPFDTVDGKHYIRYYAWIKKILIVRNADEIDIYS